MRKIVYIVAIILFFIPFFWLKPGFVDIGGDGGRLYFIDPLAIIKNIWYTPGSYVYGFADIPYLLFLYLLKQIVKSPTYLIAIEHGLQLSLGFLGMFFIAREILPQVKKKDIVGITTGVVYVSLITKIGWPVSFIAHNQVFLNVLMFYFFLRYCLSHKFVYVIVALIVSIIFSSNFGLGSAPQLFSFYPLSFLFLFLYMKFVVQKTIPVIGLLIGLFMYFGLHAMHLLPVIASLINTTSNINSQVFSSAAIENGGVDYFVSNYAELGKMSVELFQPWLGQNALALVLPIVIIMGFFHRRSKLLALIGVFFLITLFLVTANITHLGAFIYQKLFYLPGFTMFRSFHEKWYFVYAFYFSLLFAVSLYYFTEKKNRFFSISVCIAIICISIYRMIPFLSGAFIHATINNSKNVSTVYVIDPDLQDALSFVQKLPDDGKVITLPLTSTYFQIAYGKDGGAYLGISMVAALAGKPDFSGLWMLAPYSDSIVSAMRQSDTAELLELLSLFNIRYIFYNSDNRPSENLSAYFFSNPPDYGSLLSILPAEIIYQKGSYSVYEINDKAVKPLIYSPDRNVSYVKQNSVRFNITIEPTPDTEPFTLILSNQYYSEWILSLNGQAKNAIQNHITVNGYANGWIIDPAKLSSDIPIHGRIYLRSQNNFYIGIIISGITLCIIMWLIFRKIYVK